MVALLAVPAVLATAACTADAAATNDTAAGVITSLGAVPIPTTPAAQPTATASVGRPTVLAMGAPVDVTLPGGKRATVTALGPVELTPQSGRAHTVGVITVSFTSLRGSLTIHAADLSSRDETGTPVPLTRHGGPALATSRPGRPGELVLRGTYHSGAAQVTWRYRGQVVAIWDFTIELD